MTKKQKKKLVALIVSLIMVGTISAFTALESSEEKDKETMEVYLVRVVDGDTLKLNIKGEEESVRLIGIDTPESVHPDKSKNVPYGKISTEFTTNFTAKGNLDIELDVQERDRYGRILAYVYVGEKMLNRELVRNGHGVVATFPPNIKYQEELIELEQEARDKKVGLWK